MNIENLEKLFPNMIAPSVSIETSENYEEPLEAMLSDISRFLRKCPGYSFSIESLRTTKQKMWVGWNLKVDRNREERHQKWIARRLGSIIDQYEWDTMKVSQ